jgi:aldose 1-epimerase
MTPEVFGYLGEDTPVMLFTLTNPSGTEVRVINYGATIVSCKTRDRSGRLGDIALGFSDLSSYVTHSAYFGAVVGRYANRIAHGRFVLNGRTYSLATNDGQHHLHGGNRGFDKQVWAARPFAGERRQGVTFSRVSPDREEGYPGNVAVTVQYALTNDSDLIVDYAATSDASTPINLTQHTYFNLAGEGQGDILGHRVAINASRYTPVTEALVPTGDIDPVAGTPFDLRDEVGIGEVISNQHEQLRRASGYDHNFVVNREDDRLAPVARVFEPTTGRTLEVFSTEPGVQFYSGNFLDGTLVGKAGHAYPQRAGLCLETQRFPDSPNHPQFPCTILSPGDELVSQTVFRFGSRT